MHEVRKRKLRCAVPGLGLTAAMAVLLTACPEPAPEPEPPVEEPPVEEPVEEAYEAQLQEIDASGVTGTATLVMENGELHVSLSATGLEPDAQVPQHIHLNATCDPAGGILLNLDNTLTVANEADPRGDHYPTADGDGTLDYEVSRSLDDLRSAVEEYGGPGVDELDLGNRVVNLHAADMRPVACGELNPRS